MGRFGLHLTPPGDGERDVYYSGDRLSGAVLVDTAGEPLLLKAVRVRLVGTVEVLVKSWKKCGDHITKIPIMDYTVPVVDETAWLIGSSGISPSGNVMHTGGGAANVPSGTAAAAFAVADDDEDLLRTSTLGVTQSNMPSLENADLVQLDAGEHRMPFAIRIPLLPRSYSIRTTLSHAIVRYWVEVDILKADGSLVRQRTLTRDIELGGHFRDAASLALEDARREVQPPTRRVESLKLLLGCAVVTLDVRHTVLFHPRDTLVVDVHVGKTAMDDIHEVQLCFGEVVTARGGVKIQKTLPVVRSAAWPSSTAREAKFKWEVALGSEIGTALAMPLLTVAHAVTVKITYGNTRRPNITNGATIPIQVWDHNAVLYMAERMDPLGHFRPPYFQEVGGEELEDEAGANDLASSAVAKGTPSSSPLQQQQQQQQQQKQPQLAASRRQSSSTSLASSDRTNKGLAIIWQRDEDCQECSSCAKPFSFSHRRHHCRVCGYIYCSRGVEKLDVPSLSPRKVFVCQKCRDVSSSFNGGLSGNLWDVRRRVRAKIVRRRFSSGVPGVSRDEEALRRLQVEFDKFYTDPHNIDRLFPLMCRWAEKMGILEEFDEAATQFPTAVGFTTGVIMAHPKKAAAVYRRMLDKRLDMGDEDEFDETDDEASSGGMASRIKGSPKMQRVKEEDEDVDDEDEALRRREWRKEGETAEEDGGDDDDDDDGDDDEEDRLYDPVPVVPDADIPDSVQAAWKTDARRKRNELELLCTMFESALEFVTDDTAFDTFLEIAMAPDETGEPPVELELPPRRSIFTQLPASGAWLDMLWGLFCAAGSVEALTVILDVGLGDGMLPNLSTSWTNANLSSVILRSAAVWSVTSQATKPYHYQVRTAVVDYLKAHPSANQTAYLALWQALYHHEDCRSALDELPRPKLMPTDVHVVNELNSRPVSSSGEPRSRSSTRDSDYSSGNRPHSSGTSLSTAAGDSTVRRPSLIRPGSTGRPVSFSISSTNSGGSDSHAHYAGGAFQMPPSKSYKSPSRTTSTTSSTGTPALPEAGQTGSIAAGAPLITSTPTATAGEHVSTTTTTITNTASQSRPRPSSFRRSASDPDMAGSRLSNSSFGSIEPRQGTSHGGTGEMNTFVSNERDNY